MNKVRVLIATYNGSRYLRQQLQSIVLQEDVECEIWICDDGSTDETIEILEEYARNDKIKNVIRTPNVGADLAFDNLLRIVPTDLPVAFCDQDDIWELNKIRRSIEILTLENAQMVFSKRKYINAIGRQIGESRYLKKNCSLKEQILFNPAPGNTQVFSTSGLKLLKENEFDGNGNIDHWRLNIVTLFGKAISINESLVNYRIHTSNLIGIRRSFRRSQVVKNLDNTICQLARVESTKDILTTSDVKLINHLIKSRTHRSIFARYYYFIKSGVSRSKTFETILFYSAIPLYKTTHTQLITLSKKIL